MARGSAPARGIRSRSTWRSRPRCRRRCYHGTASRFLKAILAEGLHAAARHHVHLSADVETARRVGTRHGFPAVLRVDAARMHADGIVFYRSDNGVWLTDAVLPRYLMTPG